MRAADNGGYRSGGPEDNTLCRWESGSDVSKDGSVVTDVSCCDMRLPQYGRKAFWCSGIRCCVAASTDHDVSAERIAFI